MLLCKNRLNRSPFTRAQTTNCALEYRTVPEPVALSMYDIERDLHNSFYHIDIAQAFVANSSSPIYRCLRRAHEADNLLRASG